MTDYFVAGNGGADNGNVTNGAAPATNGGDDLGMDEISVSAMAEQRVDSADISIVNGRLPQRESG